MAVIAPASASGSVSNAAAGDPPPLKWSDSPFLQLGVLDDFAEQGDAAPLKVLPIQRLWDIDGTDIGHGDGFARCGGVLLEYPIRTVSCQGAG